jgi:hypothetical protein
MWCSRDHKGVGLAERGVTMANNMDKVWGVVPLPAKFVFILGLQGRPCPLYMLCAITSNKRS